MEAQSYIKSTCAHCGGHIEAPAEGAGMWVRCPHCGDKTQLAKTVQAQPATKSRSKIWNGVLIAVFVVVVVGLVLKSRIERKGEEAVRTRQLTNPGPSTSGVKPEAQTELATQSQPDLWQGLKPTAIAIQKTGNSRLIYAVGSIRNDTDKQRFGVKVTFDLFDRNGEKLGMTTDYTQFIDAHKEWNFRALVTDPKTTSAKVSAITED